jgi:hypothetical protein
MFGYIILLHILGALVGGIHTFIRKSSKLERFKARLKYVEPEVALENNVICGVIAGLLMAIPGVIMLWCSVHPYFYRYVNISKYHHQLTHAIKIYLYNYNSSHQQSRMPTQTASTNASPASSTRRSLFGTRRIIRTQ